MSPKFTLNPRSKTNRQLTSEEIKFDFMGTPHTVRVQEDSEHTHTPWKFRRSTARAYVSSTKADVDDTFLYETAKSLGLDGPYSTPKGKNQTMDNAWKKFNHEEVKLQSAILTAALEALNLNVSFRFSRTAGCNCGCSPGFIVNADFGNGLPSWVDILVDEVKPEKINRVLLALEDELE